MTHNDIILHPHIEHYYTFDRPGPHPSSAPYVYNWIADQSGKPNLPDTLGHNPRDMMAVNQNERWGGAGAVLWPAGDPHLPQYKTPGVSTGGSSDRYIQFQYYEFQWTVWGWSVGLQAQSGWALESLSDATPKGGGSALRFLSAYLPPQGYDSCAPSSPPCPPGQLISTWTRSFGIGNYGTAIGWTNPNSGSPNYIVDTSQAALYWQNGGYNLTTPWFWQSPYFPPNEWHEFVFSLEKTNDYGPPSYPPLQGRRRVYIDGTLVYELNGDAATLGLGSGGGTSVRMGWYDPDDIREGHGRGRLDGFAHFSAPIDPAAVGIDVSFTGNTHDSPIWTQVDDVKAGI